MPVNASDRQVNASECVCGGKNGITARAAVDLLRSGPTASNGTGLTPRVLGERAKSSHVSRISSASNAGP
eukprot:1595495-Prymnesium_polylepis.1